MNKKMLYIAVAAAMAAPAAQANPDLTDLLRGAAAQQQQSSSQQQSQQTDAAGSLGSIIGAFMGGGQAQEQNQPQTQPTQQPQQGGGLGSVLGGVLGGGQGGDLGGVIGGIGSALGGGQGGDIVNGITGVIEGLLSTSKLTEADLVGTWRYSSPAVSFQSENFLQKAGGAAAASTIENKIAPYYKKLGVTNLVATFNNDNTFAFKFGRVTLAGSYALNTEVETPGVFVFTFQVVGRIPLGSFNAYVSKVGNKLSIQFDASRLLSIATAICQVSGQSTLSTVGSLLGSYDGMMCGFELTKTN